MIRPIQTNTLFVADTLPSRFPTFYVDFKNTLGNCQIPYSLLPHTKDIWARDYMPIQVNRDKFVQFIYDPDYLQGDEWENTISDVDLICQSIGIFAVKSDLIIDGGNVVQFKNKAILTDKIFLENPGVSSRELLHNLENLLEVESIIIIPRDKDDFLGHADGMVRFVDEGTVLATDYRQVNKSFHKQFQKTLREAGLHIIWIPYTPHPTELDSARGVYVNILQHSNNIFLPTFNIPADDEALKLFESIFTDYSIHPIDCRELATQSGLLNCISWNVDM